MFLQLYLYLFLLLLQIWKCTRVGQTGNWQLIWPIYMPKVGDDTEYASIHHPPSTIRQSGTRAARKSFYPAVDIIFIYVLKCEYESVATLLLARGQSLAARAGGCLSTCHTLWQTHSARLLHTLSGWLAKNPKMYNDERQKKHAKSPTCAARRQKTARWTSGQTPRREVSEPQLVYQWHGIKVSILP